jgi:hypothetical protein
MEKQFSRNGNTRRGRVPHLNLCQNAVAADISLNHFSVNTEHDRCNYTLLYHHGRPASFTRDSSLGYLNSINALSYTRTILGTHCL